MLAAQAAVPAETVRAITTVPTNGREPLATVGDFDGEALFTTDESHHVNSAASMATEILSVAPEVSAVDVPDDVESEIISKDVTLIARGRRKRFRLH
jgi:hypothetical protein